MNEVRARQVGDVALVDLAGRFVARHHSDLPLSRLPAYLGIFMVSEEDKR